MPRNSLSLPARKNVDFRYSRKVGLSGRMAAEVIAEVKNIFNTVQVSSVNATVTTNAQGVPTVALPTSGDQLTPTGGYEQRQLQIGFKFIFRDQEPRRQEGQPRRIAKAFFESRLVFFVAAWLPLGCDAP